MSDDSLCGMQAVAPKKKAAPKAKKTTAKKVGIDISEPLLCVPSFVLRLLWYAVIGCHSTLSPPPMPHYELGLGSDICRVCNGSLITGSADVNMPIQQKTH